MRVALGSDHGGFELKQEIIKYLEEKNIEYKDYGCYSTESTDYPIYAKKVAHGILDGECELGILVCGTGIGMAMTANKVPGIRAAQCTDPYSAERAIKSNDAQIITFGALVTGEAVAKKLVDIWLDSEFDPSCPSGRKVEKIKELDEKWRCETAGA